MMKQLSPLSAAIAMCAIVSLAAPNSVQAAGQRGACQILPGAAVQSIFGTEIQAHEAAPTTGNGATARMCYYIGESHGATLMASYQSSAALASASASNLVARMSGNGPMSNHGHGSSLAASKGNVVLMVSVRENADAGKLKPLLAAALRGA
jgi:hypothetical protein